MTKYFILIALLLLATLVSADSLTMESSSTVIDMSAIRDYPSAGGQGYGAVDPLLLGNPSAAEYYRIIYRHTRIDDTLDYLHAIADSAHLYLKRHTEDVPNASTFDLNMSNLKTANADWDEYTGNGTAQIDGVTWSHADIGETEVWAGSEGASTSGTDYEATADTVLAVDSSTFSGSGYTMFTVKGTTVDSWRTSNTGLLFFGTNFYVAPGKQKEPNVSFYSDDNATSTNRPKLVLYYTVWPDCVWCGQEVDIPHIIHADCFTALQQCDSSIWNDGADTCHYPTCTDSARFSTLDTVAMLVGEWCETHHGVTYEASSGAVSEEDTPE